MCVFVWGGGWVVNSLVNVIVFAFCVCLLMWMCGWFFCFCLFFFVCFFLFQQPFQVCVCVMFICNLFSVSTARRRSADWLLQRQWYSWCQRWNCTFYLPVDNKHKPVHQLFGWFIEWLMKRWMDLWTGGLINLWANWLLGSLVGFDDSLVDWVSEFCSSSQ